MGRFFDFAEIRERIPSAGDVLCRLATVLIDLPVHGPAPQSDEGAAAHIWQPLMAAQIPIVLYFAFKWLPQLPRQALAILALQDAAGLAALAPVFLLGW